MADYRFWRPAILAMAIGFCVIAACFVLEKTMPVDAIRRSGVLADLEFPHPSLLPEQVIEIQLEALRDQARGVGALQCYCFASPENRLVTGPIERFTQMVRQPPFDSLGDALTYTVGDAARQGDAARSLVVVIGEGHRMRVFSWILQKQAEPPFESCWMTAGVFMVFDSQPADDLQDEVEA